MILVLVAAALRDPEYHGSSFPVKLRSQLYGFWRVTSGEGEGKDVRDHDANISSHVSGAVIGVPGVIGDNIFENEDTL